MSIASPRGKVTIGWSVALDLPQLRQFASHRCQFLVLYTATAQAARLCSQQHRQIDLVGINNGHCAPNETGIPTADGRGIGDYSAPGHVAI